MLLSKLWAAPGGTPQTPRMEGGTSACTALWVHRARPPAALAHTSGTRTAPPYPCTTPTTALKMGAMHVSQHLICSGIAHGKHTAQVQGLLLLSTCQVAFLLLARYALWWQRAGRPGQGMASRFEGTAGAVATPELGSEACPHNIVRGRHALYELARHIGVRHIGCQIYRLRSTKPNLCNRLYI